MTHNEIILLARDFLEDTAEPYRWGTATLIACYNAALEKFYRRVYPVIEESASFCTIEIPCNTYSLAFDPRIIDVEHCWLNSNGNWLTKKNLKWLNTYYPAWRDTSSTAPLIYCPDPDSLKMWIYPKYVNTREVLGASNVTFATGPNTITYALGGLTAKYAIGNRIEITNAGANNMVVTVTNVSGTVITVSQTLTAAVNTSAILRKIEDSFRLSVYRLPLASVTNATLTSSPEVRTQWHMGFIHGIMAEAYGKQDTDTYDPKSRANAMAAFEDVIEDAMIATIDSRQDGQVCHAHEGMI